MGNKVIFAETDATVHVLVGEKEKLADGTWYEPHRSVVLRAGETITPNEVTSYLNELVSKGKAPGLALYTPVQVKRIQREAAIARGEVNSFDLLKAEEESAEKDEVEVEEKETAKLPKQPQ